MVGLSSSSSFAALPDGDQECRSRDSGAVVRDGSSNDDHRRQGLLGPVVRPPRWTKCRKLAGVLASLVVLQKSAGDAWRWKVCGPSSSKVGSVLLMIRGVTRGSPRATKGPVSGRLSMEGILVCGKEAFFTRVLSREQARSSEGPFGFPSGGDGVPEDRLSGWHWGIRSLG